MEKSDNKIYKDLRALSIPECYQGEKFLYAALQIVRDKPTKLCCITKEVYPDIAKLYHTSGICVERNLRTFITRLWEEKDYMNKVAGKELEKKPTNKEFVDMMAIYLGNEEIKVF